MSEFPRDDLFRMVELAPAEVEFRAEDDADHIGVLTGYAAVFNSDTEINGWEGRFIERIAPGAFAKTLNERGSRVKVLFNHGFDPSIGEKPLGKPRAMEERKKGLYVEVPLDDTSYNRDLVASLRSGALDGMSFRFSVTKEEVESKAKDGLDVRTITELKLYELGPVTFPAYEATTVGVRSRQQYELFRQSAQIPSAPEAASGTSEETPDEPPSALDGPVNERKRRTRMWVVRLNDAFPETK